jgi:hypothetical protein
MALIPLLLNFTCFLIMHFKYDLYGEKQAALKPKLREMGL